MTYLAYIYTCIQSAAAAAAAGGVCCYIAAVKLAAAAAAVRHRVPDGICCCQLNRNIFFLFFAFHEHLELVLRSPALSLIHI